MPRLSPRTAVLFALLLVPSVALGYGIMVHDVMPHAILAPLPSPWGASVGRATLPGVADRDLTRFRLWLYDRAVQLGDTTVRSAFQHRYPTPASFTPRALKEFLMMDGSAAVLGVDSFALVDRGLGRDRQLDPHPPYVSGTPLRLELALQLGSDFVDLDRRNENRLLRDSTSRVVMTVRGDTVPFDPMTLNMGRLTGTSSQAHAHYGFNHHPKSSAPGVLRGRPWDFAVAIGFGDSVATYAEANAQIYTDLAFLALLEGGQGSQTLSALYAGNAFHYVEDVGNAIHTLQVGGFGFFIDATLYRWWRRAVTLFGLRGPTASRNSIGVDIVTNHHLMSEALFQAELRTALAQEAAGHGDSVSASMKGALRALREGNAAFRDALSRRIAELKAASGSCDCPAIGTGVTYAVIEHGNVDGSLIYRYMRDMGVFRLRRSPTIDFDTIPEAGIWKFVSRPRSRGTERRLAQFNAAQARGLARVHEALAAWWSEYLRVAATPPARRAALEGALVHRLIAARLQYLDDAESRRATWISQHGGLARR